jgi:hypothetical protein
LKRERQSFKGSYNELELVNLQKEDKILDIEGAPALPGIGRSLLLEDRDPTHVLLGQRIVHMQKGLGTSHRGRVNFED